MKEETIVSDEQTKISSDGETGKSFSAIALEYAKSIESQAIHDPNGKKTRRKNRTYTGYTRPEIEEFLKAPTTNESALRSASNYMYQTSSRYRNLLSYYASLPCWYYVVSALKYNPEKQKSDSFKRQYLRACNVLESMGISKIMSNAMLTALREGVFFGVIWGGDGNNFILQKLDPDYCNIVSVGDGGVFNFTYDMSQVKEEEIGTYYPEDFRAIWSEYQTSGEKNQLVPQEISFCLKADPTVPEYSVPPFASVLPTLFAIRTIENLTEVSEELQNYKLLAAKMPVDENGVPTIDYNTAMTYYQHISKNVADEIGLCITPFDIKDFDFQKSASSAQIDSVSQSVKNFYASAGTTATLHGEVSNSSAVTKLAVAADAAYAFTFVEQCEKIINRILKNQSGSQKFKIRFLPVNIFNREEMISKYKEAMNYGIGKIEYMACLGIPQYDIANKGYIEDDVIDLDTILHPLKTASTQTAEESQGAGRPAESDGEITESGEQTRDNDSNANR